MQRSEQGTDPKPEILISKVRGPPTCQNGVPTALSRNERSLHGTKTRDRGSVPVALTRLYHTTLLHYMIVYHDISYYIIPFGVLFIRVPYYWGT